MASLNELYDKWANSPESKLKHRLWMFNNNFRICDGNYNDLQTFYNKINNPAFMNELRRKPDRPSHYVLINLDILRRISNYLSSAFTLVDYARDYMRDNYSHTEVIKEYEENVKKIFINNNLSKFIQDLRNFFLHNGINGFSYSLSSNYPLSDNVKFSTIIQKKDLEKGDYFTAKAKEYILSLPDGIDIFSEIQKYHALVLDFYTWLFAYLNEYHKAELDIANSYEKAYYDEMIRLWNEHHKVTD